MRNLYLLNVTVHVLAAMLWLGGMFFLAGVGASVLREVEPPELRAQLCARVGRGRVRGAGWGAIAVLVASGIGNIAFSGLFRGGAILRRELREVAFGHNLAWKLASVAAMIAVSALHDLWLGPLAGRLPAGSPEALRMRRRAA